VPPELELHREAHIEAGAHLDREDTFHMIPPENSEDRHSDEDRLSHLPGNRITIYLANGGDLEKAPQVAAHEGPRTTKLYDRRNDVVSLDEVEEVVF
jgi:hypothetical protein